MTTVTPETLAEKGLIKKADEPVVILGRGELAMKLNVKAHRFSKSAQEKIEAGGRLGRDARTRLLTGPRATVKKLRKEQLADPARKTRGRWQSKIRWPGRVGGDMKHARLFLVYQQEYNSEEG